MRLLQYFRFLFVFCGLVSISIAGEMSIEKLAGGYVFTEGPAVDTDGNVWLSDDPIFLDKAGGRIYRWNKEDGTVSQKIDGSNHANGYDAPEQIAPVVDC